MNPETSLTPSFKRTAVPSPHICPVVVPVVKTLVPIVKAFFSLVSHPTRHDIIPALVDYGWISLASRDLYIYLKMIMGMAKLMHKQILCV